MRNCAAIAIDHHFSYEAKGGVDKLFQINPKITKNDYEFIRRLSKWNGGPINMYTPYFICQLLSGEIVPAKDVIGNGNISFRLILPQAILHTTLRDMKQHDDIYAQTQAYELLSQPTIDIESAKITSNNVSHWHHILVRLHLHTGQV